MVRRGYHAGMKKLILLATLAATPALAQMNYGQWQVTPRSMHQMLAEGYRLAQVFNPPAGPSGVEGYEYFLTRESEVARCREMFFPQGTYLSCLVLTAPVRREASATPPPRNR
jgi:hypothetical protein